MGSFQNMEKTSVFAGWDYTQRLIKVNLFQEARKIDSLSKIQQLRKQKLKEYAKFCL